MKKFNIPVFAGGALIAALVINMVTSCSTKRPTTNDEVTVGTPSVVVEKPTIVYPEPTIIPEPVVPTSNDYVFNWRNPTWTKALVIAIKEAGLDKMTTRDMENFGWKEGLDPIMFWGNILVEMAYWESKWKTEAKYKESFNDSTGKAIYSRGLYQLSIESGRGYKCPFVVEADLHVPELNIRCAVLILSKWVKNDNIIAGKEKKMFKTYYKGGARYWAVLRGVNSYTKQSLAAIKKANK